MTTETTQTEVTAAQLLAAARRPTQPYTVAPFSGANYGKNSGKCGPDASPCAICGKAVKDSVAKHFAVVIDGGARWGDAQSDETDPGYMGGWPVGNDCHRKYAVKGVK